MKGQWHIPSKNFSLAVRIQRMTLAQQMRDFQVMIYGHLSTWLFTLEHQRHRSAKETCVLKQGDFPINLIYTQ